MRPAALTRQEIATLDPDSNESRAIVSTNPASGKIIAVFEPWSDIEIDRKLQAADAAFEVFRRTTFAERSRLLLAVGDLLERENETIARLIGTEVGKLLRASREEVAKCIWACRYFAEHAPGMLADELVPTEADQSYVRYEPLGPILAVMTWNYPFWQVFRFASAALMAGNVCLIKHAPNVPLCSLALESIFLRAGAPVGVFQSLMVRAGQVNRIVADHRVAAVTVTGSIATGRRIASTAGECIKKVVLELGGNDAFIVMPSADLTMAVEAGVDSRVTAAGQSCTAAKRFIVAEVIADTFERQFVAKMEALTVGDPMDEETDVGPLATAQVLSALERQVRESAAQGCRVLTGGGRVDRPGYYFRPTVLAEIQRESPAYREELYGPVAAVFRVKDIGEAIRLANDSNFGLGASVWTRDPVEQRRFVGELRAGLVFVNKRVRSDPRLPFGGTKDSGFGRELGPHGVREFTATKTVWIEKDGRPPYRTAGGAESRSDGRPG